MQSLCSQHYVNNPTLSSIEPASDVTSHVFFCVTSAMTDQCSVFTASSLETKRAFYTAQIQQKAEKRPMSKNEENKLVSFAPRPLKFAQYDQNFNLQLIIVMS